MRSMCIWRHLGFRTLAAACAFFFNTLVQAQTADRADIILHFGGPGSDGANAIAAMANGGYVLAGWKAREGEPERTESWIIKVDARGGVMWDTPLPASAPYGVSALTPAFDGGLITVDGDASGQTGRTRLSKISPNGAIEMQMVLGNATGDIIHAIRPTFDGGLIAVGQTTHLTHGRSDGWILKLDRTFTVEWFRTLGAPLEDAFEDIALTPQGDYIAAGWTTLPEDFVQGWIVQFDGNGSVKEETRHNFGAMTEIHGIAVTPASQLVFAATTDTESGDGRQIVIGAADQSGTTLWQSTIGAGITAEASDLALAGDGSYLLSATIVDGAGRAGLVVDFTAAGRIEFAARHDGPDEQHALAIAPRRPDGYALAGSSIRTATLNQDVWLVIRSAGALGEINSPTPEQ